MEEETRILISEEEEDERLDKVLHAVLPELSRSYLQELVRSGALTGEDPDGQALKSLKVSRRVREGECYTLKLPPMTQPDIRPEEIPLDILYEDAALLVVNKPQGMVVHPAAGHTEHTLVNALLWHCTGSLSGINGVLRPGIVHRIDRDTSGSLIICKTDEAHRGIAEQLSDHSIRREYLAILCGSPAEDRFTVRGNIGRDPSNRLRMAIVPETQGRHAVTHVRVEERLGKYTLVRCRLETGRTHQIRVHLSSKGLPILGDPLYGGERKDFSSLTQGQCLHAQILEFTHPVTGERILTEAPLPENFAAILDKLHKSVMTGA